MDGTSDITYNFSLVYNPHTGEKEKVPETKYNSGHSSDHVNQQWDRAARDPSMQTSILANLQKV